MTGTLRWLPAVTAAAYLATVLTEFRGLVHALYWDTDVAGPFVLAERLRGHGQVFIPHDGAWTSLWWTLATRHVSDHRVLWEGTGYFFALLGVVLLAWATARVAGRWAALTAAAAALVVGPLALRALLTVVFHAKTPFTTIVLAAYLVLLARRASLVVAVLVGLAVGANAAGDPLIWIAGVIPFAVAAALLARAARLRAVAVAAAVALAVSIVAAIATNEVMHSLGYEVFGRNIQLAAVRHYPGNALQLGRMVALVGGANYALPGGYPREPLRIILAVLVCLGVIAAIAAPFVHLARRSSPLTRAYASFWSVSVVLLGISFVVTTNATSLGAGSFTYLLTLAPAIGAGIALVCVDAPRAQVAVAAAVAFAGAINMAGIVDGHAGTPRGAIATYEQPVIQFLTQHRATRGYAGYWDAQNLTWQSRLRVLVAPVANCGTTLCPFNYFTIKSWYDSKPSRSFLIVDPSTTFVTKPPGLAQRAETSRRFGPLTVYVFSYDIARDIR